MLSSAVRANTIATRYIVGYMRGIGAQGTTPASKEVEVNGTAIFRFSPEGKVVDS
jgi:hypothetical protein